MRHVNFNPSVSLHSTPEARQRLYKRRSSDRLLRFISLGAISLVGLIFLSLALFILWRAAPALISHHVSLPQGESLEAALGDTLEARAVMAGLLSDEPRSAEEAGTRLLASRADVYLKGLATAQSRSGFSAAVRLIASDDASPRLVANAPIFAEVIALAEANLLSQARSLQAQALRRSQLLQGLRDERERLEALGATDTQRYFEVVSNFRRFSVEREQLAREARALEDRARSGQGGVALDAKLPSFLIFYGQGIFRVVEASERSLTLRPLLIAGDLPQSAQNWRMVRLEEPEASRSISDLEAAYLDRLKDMGLVSSNLNLSFFTRGNSTSAERAGIGAALLGTLYALMVAMLIALPLGVAASLRLKELERKAWFSRFKPFVLLPLSGAPVVLIGLFALVVLVQFFDLAPASPLLAGLVLGMVALPHVMAATEKALSHVPPLRKEAAFALGATRSDVLFHHVLPPSLPAIFSGALVAFASAIGQAAPLLVLGFVIFAVDAPSGLFSVTTTLPVQIFIWADEPDAGFAHRAAAGIIVLLALVACLHLAANLIRARFAPKGASHG